MHVRMYVCMYACMYVCMYVYMYVYMYVCMYVCLFGYCILLTVLYEILPMSSDIDNVTLLRTATRADELAMDRM